MDASAMKLVLQAETTERRIFDAIARACGSFIDSKELRAEYGHAVRQSGGLLDDLARTLDGLPDGKEVECKASAMKAAESKLSPKALGVLPQSDRHLLVVAVTESASYIVSNDSGVVESRCRKLALVEHGVTICTPDEFWASCEEATKRREAE